MRKSIYANWKMSMTAVDAESFFASMPMMENTFVGIAPSYTVLPVVREMADRLNIDLCAQNMHENKDGPHTGDVSATMIKEAGATIVILGHSERRHSCKESDELIEKKVETAVVEGIRFILCVGETLEEYEEGSGGKRVIEQLQSALSSLTISNIKESMIAYEPVWAIGTGKAASDTVIEEMHSLIRDELTTLFGEEAKDIPILYGGSVTSENLDGLLTIENVDGSLVGGASLDPETFAEMIQITGDYI